MILIGGEQKNQAVKTDGICTCLAASMGMGGGYVPMIIFQEEEKEERERCQFVTVFEIRRDEGGARTWNDGVIGTLRTIEACGEKYVIEKYEK